MLKYPAVKSQRAPENEEDSESRRSMDVTAEYSVEVSGVKSGVNCASGYTYVRFESKAVSGLLTDGCINGFNTLDAWTM